MARVTPENPVPPRGETVEIFATISQTLGYHPSGFGLVVRERGEVTYRHHEPLALATHSQNAIWEVANRTALFIAEMAKARSVGRVVVHIDNLKVVNRMTKRIRTNTPKMSAQHAMILKILRGLDFPVRFAFVSKALNREAKYEARKGCDEAKLQFAELSAIGLNPRLILGGSSATPVSPRA